VKRDIHTDLGRSFDIVAAVDDAPLAFVSTLQTSRW